MLDTFIMGALTSLLFSIGYFFFGYLPNRRYNFEIKKTRNVNLDHISAEICGKCSFLGAENKISQLKTYLISLEQQEQISHLEAIALFHTYIRTKQTFD